MSTNLIVNQQQVAQQQKVMTAQSEQTLQNVKML